MGYIVQDRIEVSVFIDGSEFPLDTVNTLNFLHMVWSTRALLPTFHLSLSDVQHNLDSIDIPDGVQIRISLKPMRSDPVNYTYRKFHSKREFNGDHFIYQIDGYLDAPRYWTGTSVEGLRGTSTDVLSAIAQSCGLRFEGVVTNDSQLWMPRNRTYGEFARSVADCGYINDQSYMVLGVDGTGVMKYVNVNDLPIPQSKIVLGQFVDGAYTAADYLPIAKSGISNKMTGYQNTRFSQSMLGTVTTQANDQLTYTPGVKAPLFNTGIKEVARRGYQSYGGIDVGNTHPQYERAIYQNQRYAGLYSLDCQFLMKSPTTIGLFDQFVFAVDTDTQKSDLAYAGTYTTVAKAIFVTGATYAEKLLGTRQGMNTQYVSG